MAKTKKQDEGEEAVEELSQPDTMPRALFERLKQKFEEADTIEKRTLIELLDTLTAQERHPAEAEFEKLVGLTDEAGE